MVSGHAQPPLMYKPHILVVPTFSELLNKEPKCSVPTHLAVGVRRNFSQPLNCSTYVITPAKCKVSQKCYGRFTVPISTLFREPFIRHLTATSRYLETSWVLSPSEVRYLTICAAQYLANALSIHLVRTVSS